MNYRIISAILLVSSHRNNSAGAANGWDMSDEGWTLNVYPIKYQDGDQQEKYLFGWFRVTLEKTGTAARNAEIIIIQAQAENMHVASSGAFVRMNTKCGSNDVTKQKYNYVPCNWAHDPMPFVSSLI